MCKDDPSGLVVKNLLTVQETQETRVQSLAQEDPLEEEMAIHSSILAWEILWSEEPGSYSSWGCKELEATEHTYTPEILECVIL